MYTKVDVYFFCCRIIKLYFKKRKEKKDKINQKADIVSNELVLEVNQPIGNELLLLKMQHRETY